MALIPNPVVRAIDLGSGFVKANRRAANSNALEYFSFPSLAPRHAGGEVTVSMFGKRDTVVVEVDGTPYEVGPDSADLDTNDSTRNLNDMYIHTDQYKAVFYGALHYINEESIDLLVVGLPLTTLHRADELKKKMIGEHKINATTTVTVKDALVLPQPFGGLQYCFAQGDTREEFEFLREETNLIIDPGYLTFDFLVTNGEKINDARSSAHPGGVSKVLRAIAQSISNKYGIKYDNLTAIDRALERRRIKINGKTEDMLEHIRYARPTIEASVNFLRNIAGDGSDLDNIILLGGGHTIFAKTIQGYYKDRTIYVLGDAQFANVKGFQAKGEETQGIKGAQFTADTLPPLTRLTHAADSAGGQGAPATTPAPAQAAQPQPVLATADI